MRYALLLPVFALGTLAGALTVAWTWPPLAIDSTGDLRLRGNAEWVLTGGEGQIRVGDPAVLRWGVSGWSLRDVGQVEPQITLPDPPEPWPAIVRERLGAALSPDDVEAWRIQWDED